MFKIFTDIDFDNSLKRLNGQHSHFTFKKGNKYKVKYLSLTSFTIKDENGYRYRAHESNVNFVDIEVWREQKLKELLNE